MTLEQTTPKRPLRLTGVVEPWSQEDIAFEVSGRINHVAEEGTYLEGHWVEDGQVITQGGLLATLDAAKYEVALQAVNATVDRARIFLTSTLPAKLAESEANKAAQDAQYAKVEKLYHTQSATEVEWIEQRSARDAAQAQVDQIEAEFEAAKASLAQAQADLAQARLDVEHTTLRAPFSGEIAEVYVRPGRFVHAGEPVAHLVVMDPVKVTVAVSSRTHRSIQVDDPVQIFVPGRSQPFRGVVYQKSTLADPETRTFEITLLCRNRKMLLNPTQDPEVLQLPRIEKVMAATRVDLNETGPLWVEEKRALRKDDKGYFVWTLEGVTMREGIDVSNPVFTLRRVRVVPGQGRMNLHGSYFLRELSDAGGIQFRQAIALGVPEGLPDGSRVALLHESWQVRPGQLVDVQFNPHAARFGYYVPVQAVLPTSEDKGYILVVNASAAQPVAQKMDIEFGDTFGSWLRIEGDALTQLDGDTHVIVEGVNYVKPGQPVTILQTRAPMR